jgi:NADH-quinone oxidoreductase subunit N
MSEFLFLRDSPLVASWCGLIAAALTVSLISLRARQGNKRTFLLLALSAAGAMAAVSTNHFLIVLCSWMLVSVPITFLCLPKGTSLTLRRSILSMYFGDFLSFILLALGIGVLFAEFHTLSLPAIKELVLSETLHSELLFYSGMSLCLAALFSRLVVIPFHLSFFDRMVSSPWEIAAFAASVICLPAIAFGWTFFDATVKSTFSQWRDFFLILALVSSWIGSLGLVPKQSPRSFLGFAILMQGGWVLWLWCQPQSTESSIVLFAASNLVAIFLFCFCSAAIERAYGERKELAYPGLLFRHPSLGIAYFCALCGLAGLPLTGAFWGRLEILSAGSPEAWAETLALGLSWLPAVFASASRLLVTFKRANAEPLPVPWVCWVLVAATWGILFLTKWG